MNILLVRLREIGDVVFTTPALGALRQRFPDARLSYLVEPLAAPIVASNPYVDELIVAPRRHLIADIRLGLRLRARRFDLAIDFHGGPRASLLTWLSSARQRIGYAVNGRSWMYTTCVARPRGWRPRHAVQNQWDLLTPLGVPAPEPSSNPVEMPVDRGAADRIAATLEAAGILATSRLIVVHVSAGNAFRRWPQTSFAETIATLSLRDSNVRVLVISGPSEHEAASRVIALARAQLPADRRDQVVDTADCTLAELRALIDRAALFIGGDSGPLHIAATSAAAIVGLYGPTLPVRSEPWRSRGLPTEAVDGGPLPCRPCDQRVCLPGDFRCLTGIAPAAVVAAAERALAAAGSNASGASRPDAASRRVS